MANRVVWKERVAEWRTSGLAADEFCVGRGYRPSTLRWWQTQLRRDEQAPVALARVERSARSTSLTLWIGAVRIALDRDFDDATLVRVVRALSSAS